MALILKVDLEGDVRRFRLALPENAGNVERWAMIMEEIRSGFKLAGDDDFILKYKDEDGDMCTLVQDTLPDCLAHAAAGPVRLVARRSAAPAAEPAAAAATAAPTPAELDPAELFKMAWGMKKVMRAMKGKSKGKGKCGWRRHSWMQEAQAGHCPGGHELTAQSLGGVCDRCGTGFGHEDAVMGCRICNWDLCEKCSKKQGCRAEDADAPEAPEAGSDAWSGHDGVWTAEPPMHGWEALFAHLKGKGKGKCKGKGKWGWGPWGKGMWGKGHGKCGEGWKGMHWGEGHHEGHHFDPTHFWQHMAAHCQAGAAQHEPHWAQHMHSCMGTESVNPLAAWSQSPWGQMVNQWGQAAAVQTTAVPQPSAPPAEDVDMIAQQPKDGKKEGQ